MSWLKDLFTVGRHGLIEFNATGGGLLNKNVEYHGYIEVEEIECHNDLSRIKVVKISGAPNTAKTQIPEWIKTDSIDWLEEMK